MVLICGRPSDDLLINKKKKLLSALSFLILFYKIKLMKKFLLVILVSLLLCSVSYGRDGREVHILVYHTFLGSRNNYSFSQDELRKQCMDLMDDGYEFISWPDFVSGNYRGSKNILLTIDDGHRTVYDAYKHVLAPLKIKPLLAVYPAVTGKQSYALTWNQLKEMISDGCGAASHGYFHNYCTLDQIRKNPESVKKEISYSKEVLEKRLGITVDTFVFPFGAFCEDAVRQVQDAGYVRALTLRPGAAYTSCSFEIPRTMVTRKIHGRLSSVFSRKEYMQASVQNMSDSSFTAETGPVPADVKGELSGWNTSLSKKRTAGHVPADENIPEDDPFFYEEPQQEEPSSFLKKEIFLRIGKKQQNYRKFSERTGMKLSGKKTVQ